MAVRRAADGEPDAGPNTKNMTDLIFIAAIFGFWLLLQLVILPKLGYGT